mmetsp:Transcript_21634/g.29721  ORF Transcript_21634/g.29721 Transcript_21634/m.29721 type:complete len:210 (+) Transcript_21634:110-739(+)
MAASGKSLRVVLQHCRSAELLVDNQSRYVRIGPGIIIYVCFFKGISEKIVEQAAKEILTSKIYREFAGDGTAATATKPVNIQSSNCDLLVIPQASIAGKLKGKSLQHHQQIDKETGQIMWENFISSLGKGLPPMATIRGETQQVSNEQGGLIQSWPPSSSLSIRECNGFEFEDGQKENRTRRLLAFGTYGNRQGLNFASDGPFTLVFDW